MDIKENSKTIFVDPENDAIGQMGLPDLELSEKLVGEFDYIHFFVKTQSEFKENFHKLKEVLNERSILWGSWPKGGILETDLNIKSTINLGYDFGLVESTCLSIYETWSGLKFTHSKQGKVYNNSYGKLKGQ